MLLAPPIIRSNPSGGYDLFAPFGRLPDALFLDPEGSVSGLKLSRFRLTPNCPYAISWEMVSAEGA